MKAQASPPGVPVRFSILIALVGTEDVSRIFETLEALRHQEGDAAYEVILADRRNDACSQRIDRDYPEVCRIACPAASSIPELRTMALDRAVGEFVVVTEDHCVPSRSWLLSFDRAFEQGPDGTVAVAGAVENGVTARALDWATFLCEYSAYLPPVTEGSVSDLPGVNIAYRRTALGAVDRERLTAGFWETTVHGVLQQAGGILVSCDAVRISHRKRFSLRLFTRQRYLYSRYYAARRFAPRLRLRRLLAVAASVLLPLVLLNRIRRRTARKRLARTTFWKAVPFLLLFVCIWAWGEMVGYLFGAGDALEEIE